MLQKTKKFAVFCPVAVQEPSVEPVGGGALQQQVFEEIFSEATLQLASELSISDRTAIRQQHAQNTSSIADAALIYGELHQLAPFIRLIDTLCAAQLLPPRDTLAASKPRFYDLGSGSGRAVVAAALLYPFARCEGVELLPSLHALTTSVVRRYYSLPLDSMTSSCSSLRFVCGSMLDLDALDWTDGDVVFANSTCFTAELMTSLAALSKRMREGSVFITLTHRLPSSAGWRLIEELRCEMSWGMADFYVQRKFAAGV